jgi:hypothetical protein
MRSYWRWTAASLFRAARQHWTIWKTLSQEEIPAFQWWFVTDRSTGLVSIGHTQAQTLDVFRSIIEAGVTECDQIAAEMKVPKYTVSRLAKKAIDAGWLRKRGRNYELVKPSDEGEKNGKKKVKK